jgi:hypothetical protein
MRLDPDAIRRAMRELRRAVEPYRTEKFVLEHEPDYDAMCELFDPLVDAHGADAVVETLREHKHDPDLAEALFFVCWNYDRNMLTVFSEEEVIEAAVRFLAVFREGELTDTRGLPHWGWSALWQHYYDSDDHLTDEEAFRILLAVIERVPMDAKILWMIGDGPLSHAWGKPECRKRIEGLAQTEPKIARAVELDDETSRDREQLHYILRDDRPPRLDTRGSGSRRP